MDKNLAPIVLFAYNRLDSLEILLDSLCKNTLASESELHVFVDGPKNACDKEKVDAVKAYILSLHDGFGRVVPYFLEKNIGLANSIIKGVTLITKQYGKAIVLEDDLYCSPDFLVYMNNGLNFYEQDKRIISVCGYGLKIKRPSFYKPDVYIYGRSSSWGWGTWYNRWNTIDWEVRDWDDFKADKKAIKDFNRNGSDLFSMLKACMEGKNHSWAIRFCYAQYKQQKYSIFPFISKIENNGFGMDATNCKVSYSRFKTGQSKTSNKDILFEKELLPEKLIINECVKYHSIPMRLYSKLRNLI